MGAYRLGFNVPSFKDNRILPREPSLVIRSCRGIPFNFRLLLLAYENWLEVYIDLGILAFNCYFHPELPIRVQWPIGWFHLGHRGPISLSFYISLPYFCISRWPGWPAFKAYTRSKWMGVHAGIHNQPKRFASILHYMYLHLFCVGMRPGWSTFKSDTINLI